MNHPLPLGIDARQVAFIIEMTQHHLPGLVLVLCLSCGGSAPLLQTSPETHASTAQSARAASVEPLMLPLQVPTAAPAPAASSTPDPWVSSDVLAPAPIPATERLMPCRIELTRKVRDVDVSDDTWKTVRRSVTRMVRRWEETRADMDWDADAIAPIPMTLAQARANLPNAEEIDLSNTLPTGREGEASWVQAHLRDGAFTYAFDAKGRTMKVDWDPVADSGVYVFRYSYACGKGGGTPFYDDEATDSPRAR